MKTALAFAVTLCLAGALHAADKPAKSKGKKYPDIIVIPPVPEVKDPEAGKIISSEMSGRDLKFFHDAIEAGMISAYLADLAKTRGDAEQVKKIGETLWVTQIEENKQIAKLAAMKGVQISSEPPAAQAKLARELDPLTGPKFDKVILEKLLAACNQAVTAYESAAQSADKEIKTFIEQMLPVSKMKLQLASKMSGSSVQSSGKPAFRTGGAN